MQKLSINRKPTGTLKLRRDVVTAEPAAKKTAKPEKTKAAKPAPAPAPVIPQEYFDRAGVVAKYEKRQEEAIASIKKLRVHWPDAFSLDKPRPLAIGIYDAMKADAEARGLTLNLTRVRYAVGAYTSRIGYFEAFATADTRINLDGSAGAPILDKEREHAASRLAKAVAIREKMIEHKKQIAELKAKHKIK